jgi:CO dehydrogenase maturation factor
MQVGKIAHYGQGCDGPLEKVARDCRVTGDAVCLIDMKAGIEHFGRKVPDRSDVILGILDYTLESVSIAERIDEFCQEAGVEGFYLILKKIGSEAVRSILMEKLADLQNRVIGSIAFDQGLSMAGLSGNVLGEYVSLKEVVHIVDRLEKTVFSQEENG